MALIRGGEGGGNKPEAFCPVVHAWRKSYTALLRSRHALDLITLGCAAKVLRVSMAMSKSSGSSPRLWMVRGPNAEASSGGGVTMAAVFNFLEGASARALCWSFRFDLDLAISFEGGVVEMLMAIYSSTWMVVGCNVEAQSGSGGGGSFKHTPRFTRLRQPGHQSRQCACEMRASCRQFPGGTLVPRFLERDCETARLRDCATARLQALFPPLVNLPAAQVLTGAHLLATTRRSQLITRFSTRVHTPRAPPRASESISLIP